MASLKGTQTEKNLLASFAGESQARSRYTMFAKIAKKEGYEQIRALFLETAENELEHAKRFWRFLEGEGVEITAMYPAGKTGTTAENLAAAADGENEEWTKLYPEAAKIAEAVISLVKELNDPSLDDEQFIKELYMAYTRAFVRGEGRKDEGEQLPAVPIGVVMQEIAFLKQKRSFRIDPKKENFTSYGRVKFSYDLARLKTRRCGEKELRLVIASMEQTKKEETSLWVPKIPQGDGTHYAFVVFN